MKRCERCKWFLRKESWCKLLDKEKDLHEPPCYNYEYEGDKK